MAGCRECSWPGFRERVVACKHVRAVRLWMAAYLAGAVDPTPRPATPDVVDDADIDDELVSLTPEGAAYLVERRDQTRPTLRYEDVFPSCAEDGCQDDLEPRSLDCYRHQLVDAF